MLHDRNSALSRVKEDCGLGDVAPNRLASRPTKSGYAEIEGDGIEIKERYVRSRKSIVLGSLDCSTAVAISEKRERKGSWKIDASSGLWFEMS